MQSEDSFNKLHRKVVRLMCDNTTEVSYVKQEGETKSFRLIHLTIRFLKFCEQMSILVIPVHIPGIATYRPMVSRVRVRHSRRTGKWIAVYWIQYSQDGDSHGSICSWLTANGNATVCITSSGSMVAFTIAMSIPWTQMGTGYTFPPFKMIPAVKAKLRESHAITMILIAPYCMDASWMLELLQLSRDTSIPVVDNQKPLTQFIFSAEELRIGRAQICTCGNS